MLAFLVAACDYAAAGSTELESDYDALVGTWTATSFVVSNELSPGRDAADLTRSNGHRKNALEVTLQFASDRTGRLEIHAIPEAGSADEPNQDQFSVTDVTDATLTLAISGQDVQQTVTAQYFRSDSDRLLTLKFHYLFDMDGDGTREKCLVIGTFRKKS
jgi:hypothetical protein